MISVIRYLFIYLFIYFSDSNKYLYRSIQFKIASLNGALNVIRYPWQIKNVKMKLSLFLCDLFSVQMILSFHH